MVKFSPLREASGWSETSSAGSVDNTDYRFKVRTLECLLIELFQNMKWIEKRRTT